MTLSTDNVFAVFYHLTADAPWPNNLQKLMINDQQIKFFQDTLYDDCLFECNEEGWWLTYFKGSTCEQRFHVTFMNYSIENKDRKDSAHDLGYGWPAFSAILIQLISEDGYEVATEVASQAIRQSNSIQWSAYHQGKYGGLHVDGKGLSLITVLKKQLPHFERKLLLLALAHAYLAAIEQLYNHLALTVKQKSSPDELTSVYQQAAEFNARFYFPQPVKVRNTSLSNEWQLIEKSLGIVRNNTELATQIQNIHYIIDFKVSREAQKREQKRNWWFAIFGLVFAALGLLELLK